MSCPFCRQEHVQTVEQALSLFAETPARLRAVVAAAAAGELEFKEPKPGGWSAIDVAAHLADNELIYSVRYRKLLAEDEPALPTYDQERWVARLTGREPGDLLAGFEALRKQNAGLLRGAPEAALNRGGTHAEYGRLTARQLLLHSVYHDEKHLAQIGRVRAAFARAAGGQ